MRLIVDVLAYLRDSVCDIVQFLARNELGEVNSSRAWLPATNPHDELASPPIPSREQKRGYVVGVELSDLFG
jgi:hypothetical protein